jgi:diguanylate cyclase (GGDEF)-like protein
MPLDAILAVLLGFVAVCYALLGARVAGGVREFGSVPLGITFFVIALWVLGGSVEWIAPSYFVFSLGNLGHYVGTAIAPVLLLICFRQYTGSETSKTAIAFMFILPFCSIAVAATNEWHELMWRLPNINAAGEFLTQPKKWGPWFIFVHAPYGYSMILMSVMTLLLHSTAVAPAQRRGLFLLAGATLVPIIAVGANDLGLGPDTYSIIPLVFAAMLPIYAWLIIGERIMEYSPLAYETVFQNMQDPVIVVDDQQRIIGLNHGAEAMLDITEHHALRASLESVFGADVPEVYEALETGKPQKMMTATGRFLHLQVTSISPNKNLARSGRVLMFRDVSDVERAQKEVQNSEKLLRTLIDHSVNGILRLHWVKDAEGSDVLRCIFANSAAAEFLKVPTDDLVDSLANEIMVKVTAGMDTADAERLTEKFEYAAQSGRELDTEARISGNGRGHWLRVIAEPVGEDVAVTLVDITDRKAEEMRMESIASSDPLTGVLNRRGFERDATKCLAESDDDAAGALLYIDLNEFKQINDSHGHEAGDQLLTIAAQRLKTSLRSCDIIGRPGGDEFVALVPDVQPDVAEKLARRLTISLGQPYLIGPDTLECSSSIGLATYPANANTLTGLMRAADQAMYRAKERYRDATDSRDLLEKAV